MCDIGSQWELSHADICKYDLIIDSYGSLQKAGKALDHYFRGGPPPHWEESFFSLLICSASEIGGLTPLPTLLQAAEQIFHRSSSRFRVLIRPRPGNFEYDPQDISMMMDDIRYVMKTCASLPHFGGLVLGGTREGKLDVSLIISAISLARTYKLCKFTINSAIDLTTEPVEDLVKKLCELAPFGCDRCLTGGRFREQNNLSLIDLRALYMGLFGKMNIILTRPLRENQFEAFLSVYKIPVTLIQISAKEKRGEKPLRENSEDELLSRCFGVCDDLNVDTLVELATAGREIRNKFRYGLDQEFFEKFNSAELEDMFAY